MATQHVLENEALLRRYERVIQDVRGLVPRIFPTLDHLSRHCRLNPNRLYRFLSPGGDGGAVPTVRRTAQVFFLTTLEQVVQQHRWHLITWPIELPPDFDPPDDEHQWYWQRLEQLRMFQGLSGSDASTLDGLRLIGGFCVDGSVAPTRYRAPLAVSVLACMAALVSYPERLRSAPLPLLTCRLEATWQLRKEAREHAALSFDRTFAPKALRRADGYAGVSGFYLGAVLRDEASCERGFEALLAGAAAAVGQAPDRTHPEGLWHNLLLAANRLAAADTLQVSEGLAHRLLQRLMDLLERGPDPRAADRYLNHPFDALRAQVTRERPALHRCLGAAIRLEGEA